MLMSITNRSSHSHAHARTHTYTHTHSLLVYHFYSVNFKCNGPIALHFFFSGTQSVLSIQWKLMGSKTTYSGKKIFDPLLILYVFPLTNKWSAYNFNGRFIWTVRDRTTTKKSRKTHFKKVINWFITQLRTWWQNPCWQSQRSDVSCSWPPGLHTSQKGFCPTLLCRSSPSH